MSNLSTTWPGQKTSVKTPKPQLTIREPDEVEPVFAFGDEIRFLLRGEETGGRFTLFHDTIPVGGGPPPHYHKNEDEWFYPLEGEVEFFVEGQWRLVPVGAVVFLPKGKVHTFRNVGNTPLKMLTYTSPSGFETFFERSAAEFAKDGPPDMERIVEISAEHGIYFVMD